MTVASALLHARYIGVRDLREHLSKRLKEHNRGKTKSTKAYKPWILIYEEMQPTFTDARKRENFLKSGQGRKWIREEWLSGRMRRSRKPLGPQGSRRFESCLLRHF